MRSLTRQSVLSDFVRSPKTEMICAFIIAMSKDYIFGFMHQFIGDQLGFTILQLSILFLPWLLLGHGALRYTSAQNAPKDFSVLDGNDANPQLPRKNLNMLSFLFAALLVVEVIPFLH